MASGACRDDVAAVRGHLQPSVPGAETGGDGATVARDRRAAASEGGRRENDRGGREDALREHEGRKVHPRPERVGVGGAALHRPIGRRVGVEEQRDHPRPPTPAEPRPQGMRRHGRRAQHASLHHPNDCAGQRGLRPTAQGEPPHAPGRRRRDHARRRRLASPRP